MSSEHCNNVCMYLVKGRLVELLHCLEVEAAVEEVDQVGVVPDHQVPPVLQKKIFRGSTFAKNSKTIMYS